MKIKKTLNTKNPIVIGKKFSKIDRVITNDEIKQHQTIIDQSIQQQREFVIKYRRKVILK